MRKRSTLIVGLAAVVAVAAIAASAAFAGATVTGADGNTQSIEAVIAPEEALEEDRLAPASARSHDQS